MNFGQNLYQWFLSNAQSLVLMAIVVIGIYLGFKREPAAPGGGRYSGWGWISACAAPAAAGR